MPAFAAFPFDRPVATRRALAAVLWLVFAAGAGCASQDTTSSAHPAGTPAATATQQDPAAAMRAGEAAYDREDWASAESRFLDAARGDPGNAEPWFKLGNVYFKTGRYDFAAQAYEQALRRAPGHARAWHNLGVVRLHQADQSFEHVTAGSEPHDATLDVRARKMREIIDDAIDPAPAPP